MLLSYVYFYFFFLMIRRPPRSTLFPTRRSSDLGPGVLSRQAHLTDTGAHRSSGSPRGGQLSGSSRGTRVATRDRRPLGHRTRSEEHTSELQSRQYLVCRLLLEKKKAKQHHRTYL